MSCFHCSVIILEIFELLNVYQKTIGGGGERLHSLLEIKILTETGIYSACPKIH